MDNAGQVDEKAPNNAEESAAAAAEGTPSDGPAEDAANTAKAPFKKRLAAWWHGYELRPADQLAATDEELDRLPPAAATAEPEPEPEPEPDPDPGETPQEAGKTNGQNDDDEDIQEEAGIEAKPLRVETVGWPLDRIDLVQMVWGDGFASPGNENHVRNLTKSLDLKASSTVMQIGAGFGGVSRILSKTNGCKVTAWDPDEALVSQAFQHQMQSGTNFKVSVFPLNVETFEAKPDQFDGALIHETLFLIEHKEHLLRRVVESLKPESGIVLFELIFEKTNFPEPVANWSAKEVARVYPISIDGMVEMLNGMGVEVTAREDESDLYTSMALKEWADFAAKIEKEPIANELAPALMREVEYWTRRVNAIDSGWLKMYRICGKKGQSDKWG